jgi:transcriptional regulator with XRE-family HTH domain
VTPSEQIGRNLQVLRKSLGISQEELGFRAGLHRTEISLIERAIRKPGLETLEKLSVGLEAPIASLLDGIGWQDEPLSAAVGAAAAA